MTVNRLDSNRVLIILGDKDMSDFSLDYNVMSLDDSHSRRILLRIMRLACQKSGVRTEGKRVNIEALMMGEGCYLLVTVGSRRGTYRLKNGSSICYRLGGSDVFLSAIEALYRQGIYCGKNAAYELNGEYYLIFDYPGVPKALGRVLTEFAEKKGGIIAAARVRERGTPICERSAIAAIGSHLV